MLLLLTVKTVTPLKKERNIMKSQNELIEYYSKQLEKVASSHGYNTVYFSQAYYMLRGIELV